MADPQRFYETKSGIKDSIRDLFETRHVARLLFVLSEVGHAWVNIWRELLRARVSWSELPTGLTKWRTLATWGRIATYPIAWGVGIALWLLSAQVIIAGVRVVWAFMTGAGVIGPDFDG